MGLDEDQRRRLIDRWHIYLAKQSSASDNQYGSAQGQIGKLELYVLAPATVLFVGCGDGLEVAEARRRGYDAYGITLGNQDVERAKRVYGIDLINCDAHFLPLEWADRFHAVMAFQTLEHSIAGLFFTLEMHRILRSEGRFYCEVPGQITAMNDNWHHILCPTAEQIEGWLLKANFKNTQVGYLDGSPELERSAFATGVK